MFLSGKDLFMYRLNKAKELLTMAAVVIVGIVFFTTMFMAFC